MEASTADKVIQKSQAASCEQLKAQKKLEPPSDKEKARSLFSRAMICH